MISTINEGQNVLLQKPANRKRHSTFPLGAPRAQTDRYAEYTICDVANAVPDGKYVIYNPVDVRSYTLKAPMMQRPTMKQDAFFVPLMAIIPNSHDYIITNPVHGDDCPEDANTVIHSFENKVKALITNEITEIKNDLNDADTPLIYQDQETEEWYDNGFMQRMIRLCVFIDQMYNPGNLLTAIGRPMYKLFTDTRTGIKKRHNVGGWFDMMIRRWLAAIDADYFTTKINGDEVEVKVHGSANEGQINFRTWLYMLRDDMTLPIYEGVGKIDITELIGTDIYEQKYWKQNFAIASKTEPENSRDEFNYERAIAYQLITAHFYSNDKIDYIYTATLWRQNLQSLISTEIYNDPNYVGSYEYNGINVVYDSTAGVYMHEIITNFSLINKGVYEYFRMLFGWNRSLRFVDYFTGAKTEPLAVGNTSVAVNDGMVSILDVTKKIQTQKYLNAINRVGQKWEAQIKELFGIEPKRDMHDPIWLSHTKAEVGESQTENTGDEQYATETNVNKLPAITGQFVANNRFAFEVETDRNGIIMVIRYYDMPRLYCEGIDKFTKKATRFDMFNPYMQYIGDQEIFTDELIAEAATDKVFGYTGRDMEYKTRVGRAMGGFIFNLPGYAFIADKERPYGTAGIQDPHIGPSYIRSVETELDEFYTQLSGYSLDSYFHFIVMNHSTIEAKLPMTYNPQILG